MSKLFPDADDPPNSVGHVDDGFIKVMEETNSSLEGPSYFFQQLKQGMELHRRGFDGEPSTLIIAVPEGF